MKELKSVVDFKQIAILSYRKEYKMSDYFEKMYLSFEMKCAKPDPKIFSMLLEDAGINPEESLFVDDSITNLEAASEFGIKTAHIIQENDLMNDLKPFLC